MQLKITLTVYLTALFAFVFAQSASAEQKPPNVLLICVDDLRPELGCFGVNYINSPNIDEFASNGTVFHRHYVQAPTCGASRYTLLTGTYGGSNNAALFTRAGLVKKKDKAVAPSMPAWFRKHGYTTVSVGKVSHHPGGWGGDRWNDPAVLEMPEAWDRHLLPSGAWQDPRGWMHGLANGEIRDDSRTKSGGISMDVFQAVDGGDEIYPDGVSVDEALRQMDDLAADSDSPFFLAVGILRPHLPFGAPAKYLQPYESVTLPVIPHPAKPKRKTTWHRSGEFMKYNRWQRNPNTDSEFANEVRKHYAACVSYADAQVGRLIDRLEKTGSADNTIVVLWGDHGWHLGEHAIWGKHSLFEESLRSPLIISAPALEQHGSATKSIVETLDLFPTLCDLTGLETPKSIQGVSLTPILRDPNWNGRPAISYFKKAKTIRTESHRLILHYDGFVELYDHRTPEKETVNIAATEPKLVAQLTKQLKTRLSR
ncbi:MAG: sulfatase [Planctomycetaceae bacterium]|nr:sulfatase [Planctomycetaceae bacterium]